MFCNHCGAILSEDTRVCTVCGAELEPTAEAAPAAPEKTAKAPLSPEHSAYDVLSYGIIGLAGMFLFPLLGLIFSIIGKKKHAQHLSLFGDTAGPAQMGGTFSRVGFIVNLIQTLVSVAITATYLFVYFAFIVFAVLAESGAF